MQRSNVALRELEETGNPIQQDNLRRDFLELVPIAKDEKVLGFDNLQSDPYGGFVSNPIISDVQEEPLAERLESQGLPKRDAQHLAQAISNNADVFLTRDEPHFINKRETLGIQNQDSASIGTIVGNRSGSLTTSQLPTSPSGPASIPTDFSNARCGTPKVCTLESGVQDPFLTVTRDARSTLELRSHPP